MKNELVKIIALTGLMIAGGCSSSNEDPSMFTIFDDNKSTPKNTSTDYDGSMFNAPYTPTNQPAKLTRGLK